MLDYVFHANIIAYCQQNQYVWLATYIDLFALKSKDGQILYLRLFKIAADILNN